MCKVGTIKIPIKKLTKQYYVDLEISGLKVWKIRKQISLILFKLASWIIGMKIKNETRETA